MHREPWLWGHLSRGCKIKASVNLNALCCFGSCHGNLTRGCFRLKAVPRSQPEPPSCHLAANTACTVSCLEARPPALCCLCSLGTGHGPRGTAVGGTGTRASMSSCPSLEAGEAESLPTTSLSGGTGLCGLCVRAQHPQVTGLGLLGSIFPSPSSLPCRPSPPWPLRGQPGAPSWKWQH